MTKLEEAMHNLRNDVESTEHDFVVDCLKEAVSYCYEQFHNSCGEIDPLPSANVINLQCEDDKYNLIRYFLSTL